MSRKDLSSAGSGATARVSFQPGRDYRPDGRMPDRILAYFQDRLVVRTDGARAVIPRPEELIPLGLNPSFCMHLGTLRERAYAGWALSQAPALSDGLALVGLRALFGQLDDSLFQVAGYGLQLVNWAMENRYCGRCGRDLALGSGDRALTCAACGMALYPRIMPAVIVAITSGARLLLARSGRFPGRRMFSVIAGYVEPGETLEACVRREVHEEVGLSVRRIRYFGSQSWPFSGALMMGFTAEHAGGDIQVDGREIVEAGWFPPDRLPEIPGRISIARRLIDWFVDRHAL